MSVWTNFLKARWGHDRSNIYDLLLETVDPVAQAAKQSSGHCDVRFADGAVPVGGGRINLRRWEN